SSLLDRGLFDSVGYSPEPDAALANPVGQLLRRNLAQLPDGLDSMLLQVLSCFLSDTADLVDTQRVEKCPDLFWSNRCQAVGLVHVRGHLRNRLVRRDP